MWTRLQRFKIQIIVGLAFCFAHSFLCFALYKASLRNIEFGALWEHMRLTDLPVSLLLDGFKDAYWKLFGESPQSTYHKPYLLFHLIFGGLQFFAWGWLLAALGKRLLRPRCPAQMV
jgi:hypothetical protein